MCNCLIDEGRRLGSGWQEQVPNHLRRLWTKAKVVSRGGKGLGRTRSGDWQEEVSSYSNFGSSAILMQLRGAAREKRLASTAGRGRGGVQNQHGHTFDGDHLKAIDLPLGVASAPRAGRRRADSAEMSFCSP